MTIVRVLLLAAFALTAAVGTLWAEQSDGLAEYKDGDYLVAIPLLQKTASSSPDRPEIHAALLSALTYEGRVDEAESENTIVSQRFPASIPAIAARGDFAFYMGDLVTAEKLYIEAYKADAKCARAVFGISKIRHCQSLYKTARLLVLQAHVLDPDDALITSRWVHYLVRDKRKEFFPAFAAAHPWFFDHLAEEEQSASAIHAGLGELKPFEVQGGRAEQSLRLGGIMPDGRSLRGVSLQLRIEDRRPLTLQLDTGASGIIVNQSAVDKAGLDHLGSGRSWGIGDSGVNKNFYAIASTCSVGDLHFNNCLLRAQAGKKRMIPDIDGLIGPDVFDDYLIDLDLQKRTLHLTPLPVRQPSPQGFDREIPPSEGDFTPIFRFGHELCVETTFNDNARGLFLLDTGASLSNVDSTFARLSTKLSRYEMIHIRGVSGEVKDVFSTGHAKLEFARFRQDNVALLAFNLNNSPEHEEVRLSGILGFPVLYMFRLRLDYRNGLVKFDYIFDKKK
jgi:tetratricopeptide (TPR) repeat protein